MKPPSGAMNPGPKADPAPRSAKKASKSKSDPNSPSGCPLNPASPPCCPNMSSIPCVPNMSAILGSDCGGATTGLITAGGSMIAATGVVCNTLAPLPSRSRSSFPASTVASRLDNRALAVTTSRCRRAWIREIHLGLTSSVARPAFSYIATPCSSEFRMDWFNIDLGARIRAADRHTQPVKAPNCCQLEWY